MTFMVKCITEMKKKTFISTAFSLKSCLGYNDLLIVIDYLNLSMPYNNIFLNSPEGVKIRSKPHLSRYLGENFDLSAFDYRTGRIISSAVRKSKRHKGSSYDYARGLCGVLNLLLFD